MNVFLIGSKKLSVGVLNVLVEKGYTVKGVLTRDHEANMKVWHNELGHPSLAHEANKRNVSVYKEISVNSQEFQKILVKQKIDIVFSVFWGEIIKEKTYSIPKFGFYNLHTAFLPKNRGSFPMAWAIINDEKYSGVTFHKITKGVDDGPILAQKKVEIKSNETGFSLYEKVSTAGLNLFEENIDKIAQNDFFLYPQDDSSSTYNPRGYPYGGYLNPLWSEGEKDRFKRALTFPPFDGVKINTRKYLMGDSPSVRVMFGFDCDRPRGSFITTNTGSEMAERKLKSLNNVSKRLEELEIPRTYFICGMFLESMANYFDKKTMVKAFNPNSSLVEIADHSYSHEIVKSIKTRPDKIPINHIKFQQEFNKNTEIFNNIFDDQLLERGFRTPLGHNDGLKGSYKLLDVIKKNEISYVSSDLRDENDSLHPKLFDRESKLRQPYRYKNGVLEIPSIGWQDTVFSGTSKTKLFENYPDSYDKIFEYFEGLFKNAKELSIKLDRDIFVGLVIHPYDVSFYDQGDYFNRMYEIIKKLEGSFHTYKEVADFYNNI